MSQARKKTNRRSTATKDSRTSGVVMLIAGIIIGCLATILWQGMQNPDGGVGTGIREMMAQSKQQDDQQRTIDSSENKPVDQPEQQQTNFDFFTVLPEIEVVVPIPVSEEKPKTSSESSNSIVKAESVEVNQAQINIVEQATQPIQSTQAIQSTQVTGGSQSKSVYMLQAGSYKTKADADRLKAELALKGLSSTIQKVSIQGRGDFFRVRLGPYANHDSMVKVDQNLTNQGIKALRLKISKGG